MVVQVMRGASAPREGGDEQGGCTEAAQPIRVAGDPVSLGDWRGRRRHVVEEPTPLVEVDEKHRVLPRRARRDRRVNPIEKRFTGTLPQVAYVDPPFLGEATGTGPDDHPYRSRSPRPGTAGRRTPPAATCRLRSRR